MSTKEFLDASIHEVVKTLVEAIILVILVVYVFLQACSPWSSPAALLFVVPVLFIVFQAMEERLMPARKHED